MFDPLLAYAVCSDFLLSHLKSRANYFLDRQTATRDVRHDTSVLGHGWILKWERPNYIAHRVRLVLFEAVYKQSRQFFDDTEQDFLAAIAHKQYLDFQVLLPAGDHHPRELRTNHYF